MNDKFDELAKGLAQPVTRRGALKKFGLGLAGVVLAILSLPNQAQARKCNYQNCVNRCRVRYGEGTQAYYFCVSGCTCA